MHVVTPVYEEVPAQNPPFSFSFRDTSHQFSSSGRQRRPPTVSLFVIRVRKLVDLLVELLIVIRVQSSFEIYTVY